MRRCLSCCITAFGLRKFKSIACASQLSALALDEWWIWCGFFSSFGEGEPPCDQEHKATSPKREALRGCMIVGQCNHALTLQKGVPWLCSSLPELFIHVILGIH